MKFSIRTILIIAFASLLFSCGSQNDDHKGESTNHNVELNNGDKWQANPETVDGNNKMKELISDFESNNNSDYGQLKESLQQEFKLIFERCTMTGESHNQLHNYLVPIPKILKKMENGTDSEKQKAVEQLKTHLDSFSNYFK